MSELDNMKRVYKCGLVAKKVAELLDDNLDYFGDFEDKREFVSHATLVISDVDNFVPLQLDAMLSEEAHGPSVVHDVTGCMRYWDPVKRELGDCFFPRYAQS